MTGGRMIGGRMIISELIKAVEITNWQAYFGQAKVSSDFEIIVTYKLYGLLASLNRLFLYDPYSKKFMGHQLRVTPDLDDYSFWIADRQEIVENGQ